MSQFKILKFWSNNKKEISSPSALSRFNDLFNLLKIAGGLVPIVGGPVIAIGELACNLIEVVQVKPPSFLEHIMDIHWSGMFQQMKTTTEGCARLVEKAAELVLSVVKEATEVDSLTPRMMERVERLSR